PRTTSRRSTWRWRAPPRGPTPSCSHPRGAEHFGSARGGEQGGDDDRYFLPNPNSLPRHPGRSLVATGAGATTAGTAAGAGAGGGAGAGAGATTGGGVGAGAGAAAGAGAGSVLGATLPSRTGRTLLRSSSMTSCAVWYRLPGIFSSSFATTSSSSSGIFRLG